VTSNYKNVTIPTNLDVKDDVRNKFGEFYAALFDRTVEKNPGAVITEYAWDASTCDPCPGPQLDYSDFATLGADVLDKGQPYNGYQMVLTRLHARYGKDGAPDDLVFQKAEAIVGGREHIVDQQTGKLEEGSRADATNNFQGRYAIRHEWTGPIACKDPIRGMWGGPPDGTPQPSTMAGKDLAHAPRGQAQIAQMVVKDVPEIDVKAAGATTPTVTTPKTPPPSGAREPSNGPAAHGSGCCQTTGGGAGFGALALATFVLIRRRRR
jgi:uncharacterized protein (TIGR03382 family)